MNTISATMPSTRETPLKVVTTACAASPMAAPWSFDALMQPVSLEEFAAAYWARVPLHIKRDSPEFYRDVISLQDVEHFLAAGDVFNRPDVVFMRGSSIWARREPLRNLQDVYERMLRGQSLQVRNLESILDPASPLLSLVRNMEQVLQHPRVSVGCYISPPNATGLGPHHDETEIFTLQVSGRKRWHLFHQVQTTEPGLYDRDALDEPVHEVVVEAGDLFYHPRGAIHDVVSDDVPSFSITIVFKPITWKEVFSALLERISATPPFIGQLPIGAFVRDDGTNVLQEPFEERLRLLRDALSTASLDAIVDDLAVRHISHLMPQPDARFDTVFRMDLLSPDSLLERGSAAYRLMQGPSGVTIVLAGGHRVSVPLRQKPALDWIVDAPRRFRARDVIAGIEDDDKMALVKQLVTCGLLKVL